MSVLSAPLDSALSAEIHSLAQARDAALVATAALFDLPTPARDGERLLVSGLIPGGSCSTVTASLTP